MEFEDIGGLSAKFGTVKIEEGLIAIVNGIESGQLPLHPENLLANYDDYLQGASKQLWSQRHSLEPILYLWEKYYDTAVTIQTPEGPVDEKLFSAFEPTMADIAAASGEGEREIVISGAVRFITRHETELVDRLHNLARFAAHLTLNGLDEGKKIAKFIKATASPEFVEQNSIYLSDAMGESAWQNED